MKTNWTFWVRTGSSSHPVVPAGCFPCHLGLPTYEINYYSLDSCLTISPLDILCIFIWFPTGLKKKKKGAFPPARPCCSPCAACAGAAGPAEANACPDEITGCERGVCKGKEGKPGGLPPMEEEEGAWSRAKSFFLTASRLSLLSCFCCCCHMKQVNMDKAQTAQCVE